MSRSSTHCAHCGAHLPSDRQPVVERGLSTCSLHCARRLEGSAALTSVLVDVYEVDQDTGAETLNARAVPFNDCFDLDDDEAKAGLVEVHEGKDAMMGGGAAVLVRVTRHREG